jgi:hypothetical protein
MRAFLHERSIVTPLYRKTALRANTGPVGGGKRGGGGDFFIPPTFHTHFAYYVIMPIRQVPKNYRGVTGVFPSRKSIGPAPFESLLERDFFTILEFDPQIKSFEVQPLKIDWKDAEGQSRHYTPDVLVHPTQWAPPGKWQKPFLCEVKTQADLEKHGAELKPKFKAARAFAKNKGLEFKVITDAVIRIPYLGNARFLLPYTQLTPRPEQAHLALQMINELRTATPEQLVAAIANDKWLQAEILPTVWHLIGTEVIMCDLNLPLTMSSRLWSRQPSGPNPDICHLNS